MSASGEPSTKAQTAVNTEDPNDALEKKSFFSRFKKKSKKSSEPDPSDQQDPKPPPIKFFQLFQYADRTDKMLVAIAFTSAAIHGAIMPVFTILFGGIINRFDDLESPSDFESIPIDEITDEIGNVAKWFILLAAVAFITSFFQVRFQLVAAHRICVRLRHMFFESIMSQDFTWYDKNNGGELTARVAGDVNIIQRGIGDRLSNGIQFFSTFIAGIIIAFVYGPLLTLVILSVTPLLALSGAAFAKLAASGTGEQLGAYGKAGAIASEAIGLIRSVTAYGGQKEEIQRYEKSLDEAYRANVKQSIYSGLGMGTTFFILFSTYAIAFVFGSWRVREGNMDAGDVLTSFFSVLIASFSIGQGAPSFQSASEAQAAAPRIYEVIQRQSEIDPLDEDNGTVIPEFHGHVKFEKVTFNYASRVVDDTQDSNARPYVLENFKLDVPPGTSHALVGPSGCGKSTTVRLLERFYDVQAGRVTLDGIDVRELNVRWLRSQIGYVGQMPTLFMLSIKDNIALGAPMDSVYDEKSQKTILRRREVTDEQIIAAAKEANAHDFIMKLPEKYDTMLGERGALLSGGQKQRVCIARALVRNPRILILDEATAALDAQSERVVQEALEKASAGRTTITIAHRLSTVRNADTISVLDNGIIVEAGTHSELIQREGGAYRTLVEHQRVEAENVEQIKQSDADDDHRNLGEAHVVSKSVSKTAPDGDEVGKDEENDESVTDKGVLARAFKYNLSEMIYILPGILGAAMAGAGFPVMAITFSEIINVLVTDNRTEDIRRWALAYVGIGGGSFVGNFMQATFLGISGEKLTRKLRRDSFRAIMKQDMGFFDLKEHSLGALSTRLASEANLVRGVTGDTLGTMSFGISAIVTGFVVAYVACWRVALVVTGFFPLMAISGAAQMKVMTGFDGDSEKRFAGAGAVASEAVDNIDTVTSIGVQDVFIDKYDAELAAPLRNGRRTATVAGIAFGVSEALAQLLWAVSFWIGSLFVRNGNCDFLGLMKAITGLLFAGMSLGNISAMMPDLSKSKVAATMIFRLLDRESAIDPTSKQGTEASISGSVGLDKIYFEYPTRPDVAVLRGASVEVSPGQTLALVGGSGSGKSTIVALLERFYDPKSGKIVFDDRDSREYELNCLRRQMGLVSQEPDLFDRSVRDNIAYGFGEEGTPVTMDMIVSAAKAANAHSFISELPDGYDTIVGVRGNRLSGGQRQRVAIARAIMRQPRVLLLDEATSALDAVSEKVVQEALDMAAKGRTTVAIAHRLSTVKDADIIAVVSRGKIVETGTHEQLLRVPNGEYANLVKNQLMGSSSDQ